MNREDIKYMKELEMIEGEIRELSKKQDEIYSGYIEKIRENNELTRVEEDLIFEYCYNGGEDYIRGRIEEILNRKK